MGVEQTSRAVVSSACARRLGLAALAMLALGLALVLRLHQAAAPMTFDEYASLYFSDRPFGDLWGWWMVRETNPPLFYSILKLWRMVVPERQDTLRLLPLLLSLGQIVLAARFVSRVYGPLAGILCIVLFALAPSDIVQSEYLRGYALAKLAVLVSFIGLIAALADGGGARRAKVRMGWAAYALGAVVAIYSHTTMLLWPVIASGAVVLDAGWRRGPARALLARLAAVNALVAMLSFWVVWIALVQMQTRAANIAWIEPLSFEDFVTTVNLQLLMDGWVDSWAMAALMLIGAWRTFDQQVTRLAVLIVLGSVLMFKAADTLHPITSDYTLHWCASFTVLLAAATLARCRGSAALARRRVAVGAALVVITGIGLDAVSELRTTVRILVPQDWRFTVETVARTPDAALLVSHESVGLVVGQACKLVFRQPLCPFPLIVMANPAQSDSWAFGGSELAITPARDVPTALGHVRTVYAFSRYVYTPLEPLGLDPGDYVEHEWDDGELIGPIPAADFRDAGRSALRGRAP